MFTVVDCDLVVSECELQSFYYVHKVKLATVVEGDPKAPLSIATTPLHELLHFNLDPYLIVVSVKQGGIKYHFLSLWYDST